MLLGKDLTMEKSKKVFISYVRNSLGFTFIELLLVISLIVMVGTAVSTAVVQGVKVFSWYQKLDREEAAYLFLELLTKDLRNSIDGGQSPQITDDGSLQFTSVREQIHQQGIAEEHIIDVAYQFVSQRNLIMRAERGPKYFDGGGWSRTQTVVENVSKLTFKLHSDLEENRPNYIHVELNYGNKENPSIIERMIPIPLNYSYGRQS